MSIYRFHINGAYTPRTLPMERLGEYLSALGNLLGERANIHFAGVVEGSAVLEALVDEPAQPKVATRIEKAGAPGAPADVQKAYNHVDEMLRHDNATGRLETDGARVIQFPGRNMPRPSVYGPFRQDDSLDGQLIRIGGKDETVPVALQDGDVTHNLTATRDLARELGHHLFGATLRVHGVAQWFRNGDEVWELRGFKIARFEVLDHAPITEVADQLQQLDDSTWSELPDPVRALNEMRRSEGEGH